MNILVTGASKGIGLAIATELLQLGNVFVTGRNEEALKTIEAKGYCVCDLSTDVTPLIGFITANDIDVLINNAGEYIYGAIDTATPKQIDDIFATNLLAPTKLISASVPYMKKQQWGKIINIGSISGVMGEAYASLFQLQKQVWADLQKLWRLNLLSIILQ